MLNQTHSDAANLAGAGLLASSSNSSRGNSTAEADTIDPAYAVILLYVLLVRAAAGSVFLPLTEARTPPGYPPPPSRGTCCAQILMIGAQAALFVWKQRHKRSYELVRCQFRRRQMQRCDCRPSLH